MLVKIHGEVTYGYFEEISNPFKIFAIHLPLIQDGSVPQILDKNLTLKYGIHF